MVTSTKLIWDELMRFLSTVEAEAICISGEWGVGKTYTWQKALQEAASTSALKLKRYSYVSLFGLNSLEGLKQAIFENIDFPSPQPASLAKGRESIAKAAKRSLEIGAELLNVANVAKKAGPLFFSLVRDQIICLDDLERRGANLGLADVMGLVSFLKEHRRCKVILLLNAGQLKSADRQEYEAYLEKIVDAGLVFAPDPIDSARIALDLGDASHSLIEKNSITLRISNIRMIRKIARFLRILHPLIDRFDVRILEQAVHTITLLGWSKFQPASAPPLGYIRNVNEFTKLLSKNQVPAEEAAWDSVLRNYAFNKLDDFDRALLAGIENGYFDKDNVIEEASKLDKHYKEQRKLSSLTDAWAIFHGSFEDNENEFVAKIENAIRENILLISARDLNSTVAVLKRLDHHDRALALIEYFTKQRNEPSSFWDLSKQPFHDDITDPDVVLVFNNMVSQTARPVIDAVAALLHVSEHQSWYNEQLEALASMSADDYYHMFKKERGTELSKIVYAALSFASNTGAPPQLQTNMGKIAAAAKAALTRIGGESQINAVRVRKFGISVETALQERN